MKRMVYVMLAILLLSPTMSMAQKKVLETKGLDKKVAAKLAEKVSLNQKIKQALVQQMQEPGREKVWFEIKMTANSLLLNMPKEASHGQIVFLENPIRIGGATMEFHGITSGEHDFLLELNVNGVTREDNMYVVVFSEPNGKIELEADSGKLVESYILRLAWTNVADGAREFHSKVIGYMY